MRAFILCVIAAIIATVISAAATLRVEKKTYDIFFNLKRSSGRDELIEARFQDISDPARKMNGHYRNFMSNDEIIEMHRAPAVHINKVQRFLETAGCSKVELSFTKDTLMCRISTHTSKLHAEVEGAFATIDATQWKTKDDSLHRIVVSKISAIDAIRNHIKSAIAYRFVANNQKGKKPTAGNQFPGTTQTPQQINSRYGVPNFEKRVGNVESAVLEFEGAYWEKKDLASFVDRYSLNTPTVRTIGPDVTPSYPNGVVVEVMLDIEYVLSISNGTTPTNFIAQGTDHKEPGEINFAKIIEERVLTASPIPISVSISWGYGLQRLSDANELDIMWSDDAAFMKAGMAGVSVFVASGDSGAGARSPVFQCSKYIPGWPSSSSKISSVGANYATSAAKSSEEVVEFSGGGFNPYFDTPSWQKEAVNHYLAQDGLPKKSMYANASGVVGAGFPHFSALGTNYIISVNGGFEQVSGTSCASPTFSGVVAQIIAERDAAGKKNNGRIGFVSPVLFRANGKGVHDITTGFNSFSNCIPGVQEKAFPCTKGWDAASGLGSPNYVEMKEVLMAD